MKNENKVECHIEGTYLRKVADADSADAAFFYSNPFVLVCKFKCYKRTHRHLCEVAAVHVDKEAQERSAAQLATRVLLFRQCYPLATDNISRRATIKCVKQPYLLLPG